MAVPFEQLSKVHPCFALGAKNNKGRVHLPVSPGCNIQCNWVRTDHRLDEACYFSDTTQSRVDAFKL